MTVDESSSPTPDRLVPISIHPGPNLEDAGFNDEQRTDLLGWFLQVGAGAAGAAVCVQDVHYDVVHRYAWIRLEVLGPSGHGHVDVVLIVQSPDAEGSRGEQIVPDAFPADLKAFEVLTDQCIASITGSVSVDGTHLKVPRPAH